MTSRNVPRLRFKGFEDEWKKTTFEQIFDSVGGKSIEKYFDDNGDCKVISIGSYGENSSYVDQGIRVNKKDIDDKYVAHKGDLTMILNDKTTSGNIIGRVLIVDNDNFVINQRTEKLSPKMDDSLFLYYLLNATRKQNMFKIVQGGTQIYVNYSAVEKLPLIISSKKEQQHIGNFFSKLDHLIDLHSQKLEQLNKLKRGYLQKMFPQKGETVPRLRFSGFSDNWKEVELGKIGKTFNGLSGKNKKDFGHGKGLYVNYLSINKKDFVDISNTDKVDVNENENQNTLEKGDVLFTTSSETPDEVGLSSVWNSDSKAFLNSFSFGFRMNKKFDLYFSGYMFRSLAFRKEIYPLAQGISRYNLSKTNFLKLTIKFPSMEEQEKIGKYLHSLDLLIDKENSRVNELKKQKKAYLQKMFI